jgi:MoaA/NifB/PqqE/SkfB family radical SAM enzyme
VGDRHGVARSPVLERLVHLFDDATLQQRANTLLNLMAGKFNLSTICPKPWMIQLEVTNRCNLKCRFCSRYFGQMKYGDMSPALLNSAVELSAKAQEVALFGYGEPLISKAFYQLLPRLRSARVGFFTNGLLLTGELLKKVVHLSRRPLSYIVFSVDGATPETYEAIRIGSNFSRVWRNLETAIRLREQRNWRHLALRMEFVAMRSNAGELARLVRMADEAGVDELKISHLVVWHESLRDESLFYHQNLCRRSFEDARTEAAGRRLRVSVPKVFEASVSQAGLSLPPCRYPWHYAMISFEGLVQACCFAPSLVMGDLTKQTFDAIWRNRLYQALRRSLNTPECPQVCRRCEERYRGQPSPNEELTYVKLTPRLR